MYSRRTMRWASAFAAIGVSGFLSLNAWSQAGESAAADALFEAGRKAAEAGDYSAACPKFAESYRLDPAMGTLLNVADCEERLGHVATAWTTYRKAIELLAPKDARVAFAKKKVAELEKRIPYLTVKLAAQAPAGAVVTRDGVEIGASSLGIAIPVDPGKHAVIVTAPGYRERRYDLDLAESESRELIAEPSKEGASPAVAPVPQAAPPPKPAESMPLDASQQVPVTKPPAEPGPPLASTSDGATGSGTRTAGYVVGGVGVVGLVLGVVLRATAFGQQGTIDGHCSAARFCDDTGLDAVSKAKTLQTASTVSLAVGLAGFGTGLALILSNPARPTSSTALSPTVLPGGAGFTMSRSF
jgi:hypothetical protein